MSITSHDCEGSPTSVDPFSRNPMSGMTEPMKDLPDHLTHSVIREDATITASTFTTTTSRHSLLEQKEGHDCPLLQGVSVDTLPPRFQRLLSVVDDPLLPNKNRLETTNVKFYPGYIPGPLCWYFFIAFPFVMGLVGMLSAGFSKGRPTLNGGLWVGVGCVIAFTGSILCIGIAAYRTHRIRSPLFTRDNDGARKSWPGDWKAGTYLVGSSALMDFDGRNCVWLFPVDSIITVNHFRRQSRNSVYQTILVVRSPPNARESSISYELGHLDNPFKGREIKSWHQRCTRLELLDP